MADELNTPNHRYYQPQNNILLASNEVSKQFILASGIAKIDAKIINPLFAAAEPGVWYDPSDLTTLFQTNEGTTPVTAAGQTVGLMLDKSKGLALGPELVTNGAFDTDTAWTKTSTTITGGALVFSGTATAIATQAGVFVANAIYELVIDIATATAGTLLILSGTGQTLAGASFTTSGIKRIKVRAQTSGDLWFYTATSFVGTVNSISVKLLAGNHATQATSTQRPTYGINPIVGTRNLLTYTEAFTNATWLTQGGSWSAVDANGFQTFTEDTATSQHRLYDDGFSVVSGQAYTLSAQVAYGARRWVFLAFYDGVTTVTAWFDLLNGVKGSVTAGATSTMTTVSSGVYNITLTRTSGATSSAANVQIGPQSADGETVGWTGTGATTRIAKYQFELGSTATAYQKVVSQYEVTEAGVQSVSYLRFDGVDDGMVTGTITPAIDKVQVFAGVRKLSDAASGVFLETGTTGSDTGSFTFAAPSSSGANSYAFASRGTSFASAGSGIFAAAPNTSVLTGIGDIAGDVDTLRRNGSLVQTVTTDQGTGNYLAYPLYVGRRAGTSVPFNGRLYSLITRFGANLTDGQITSTESWVNAKVGAY